jgi:hypothetical protein
VLGGGLEWKPPVELDRMRGGCVEHRPEEAGKLLDELLRSFEAKLGVQPRLDRLPHRDPPVEPPREECGSGWVAHREGTAIVGHAPVIIVDPLAYYVPYHTSQREWGIYLRIVKMLTDFLRFTSAYAGRLNFQNPRSLACAWSLYVGVVYMHELAHHIVEDVASVGGKPYPLFFREEEESLCEFHAFATMEEVFGEGVRWRLWRIAASHPVFRALGAAPRVPVHCGRGDVLSILSALYHWWDRGSSTIYKPSIREGVPSKLGLLWTPVREATVMGAAAYFVSGEEIHRRVFITTR